MVSPLHVVIITHLMQFRQNRWIMFQKSIAQEHHVIDCPLESCGLVHVGIHTWYYCFEKFCCFGYAYPIGRKKCKHTLKSASQAHTLDVRKTRNGRRNCYVKPVPWAFPLENRRIVFVPFPFF